MNDHRMHASGRRHVRRNFRVGVLCLLLVFAAAACAGGRGAGLHEPLSSPEKKKMLEEFRKTWQDYNVYCDGPASSPGALIFDPKNDDRNLIGYQYIKLSKEDSVRLAMVQLEFQLDFVPMLYKIFDEEKNFYGYVLMARDLPAPRRVDPKTLELPAFQSTFHVP